jgi:peptide deformylase
VHVHFVDRNGRPRDLWGEGLMARAMSHEIDHLDGNLFLDRLRGIKRDRIIRKIQKLAKAGMW